MYFHFQKIINIEQWSYRKCYGEWNEKGIVALTTYFNEFELLQNSHSYFYSHIRILLLFYKNITETNNNFNVFKTTSLNKDCSKVCNKKLVKKRASPRKFRTCIFRQVNYCVNSCCNQQHQMRIQDGTICHLN